MKLKKCTNPGCERNKKQNLGQVYTLKEQCPECKEKTSEAHYKYVNVRGNLEKRKNKELK